MRCLYVTDEYESNEDENITSDEEINEMSYHSVDRIIDDLNGFNE